MLDVLFDCGGREGLPVDVELADSVGTAPGVDLAASEAVIASRSSTAAIGAGAGGAGVAGGASVEPAIRLGPNRPALRRFEFEGVMGSIWLLETTIYNLPLLTTLVLDIAPYQYLETREICIDVDRILDAIPQLKHLDLRGEGHRYVDNDSSPSTTTTTTFCTRDVYEPKKEVRNHPLESLTCSPLMMLRPTPKILATFRRLGNLKNVNIHSYAQYVGPFTQRAQPGEFGQILQQYCPKIESIETNAYAVLWLFRLPQFSSAYEATLFSTNAGAAPEDLSDAENERLRMELQEQETMDILTLREETPFFPRLRSFTSVRRYAMGAQDILALAAHSSQFLTHLKLSDLDMRSNVYDLYQDPSSPQSSSSTTAAAAEGIDQITIYPSEPMSQAGKKRLRLRRPANSLDYEMVLETCTSLKVVSLPGIEFRHLIETTTCYTSDDTRVMAGEDTRTTRRWACEETLESLTVGFVLSTSHRSDHRLIWRHLGRLRKLQSLELTRSTLIPSLDFGIDELVGVVLQGDDGATAVAEAPAAGEGEETQYPRQQQNRLREQNKALQKIHSLGTQWGVDDRKTVEWFAKSFPNLSILGLGFRWDKAQHRRVADWLSETEHSFELVFDNDLYWKK
ncbi:hypothetical protein BGX24_009992 [Mortierella sp. AD032]|nr:hypothetical protein BGX24_009992 [Mortierella sp. AD032]